ncbi:MAG: elongation factor P hydroxylase [Pseudomonadales bacterium]|nr:elongation factor P hydroxylase [Pseudomonadales bacterium]
MLQIENVIETFHECFARHYHVRLIGGAAEPCYQPKSEKQACNTLYFRENFFASALHEISHWCIAGSDRLRLVDWGYWYEPEGRDSIQQKAFEAVEVNVQAIELLFSRAAGVRFYVSLDNPGTEPASSMGFRNAVYQRARDFAVGERKLPPRAETFLQALCQANGLAVTDVLLSVSDDTFLTDH